MMSEVAVSAHDRASPQIKGICDLLVAGINEQVPGTGVSTSQNWCTIGKPGIAWVQHTRKSLSVFLKCAESESDQFSSFLNPISTLLIQKRKSLASDWAKKTPYFLKITTLEEATLAVPLLRFIAGKSSGETQKGLVTMPSEDSRGMWEGGMTSVVVNRYERDRKAREKCIETYGAKCAVCEFDFLKAYGEIGRGYIHVHHLVPVSTIGTKYKVNPLEHLRPVCPNCHEMLHSNKPRPFTLEELKVMMHEAVTDQS
jgi:5-methylcytosine-specific restriction endonuclease McrA